MVQSIEEKAARKRERNQRYYAANRAKLIAAEAARRAKRKADGVPNPKGEHYERKYGITEDDYQRMLSEQEGVCSLCKRPPRTHRLHVDHDHVTGRVRGLLCGGCNGLLGLIEAFPEWPERARKYLANSD